MSKTIRKDILLICSIMLLFSIGAIIFYNLTIGNEKIVQQIVRFILTLLLVIFTILDKMWAKWILSILAILGGLLGLVSSIAILSQNVIGGIFLLIMGIYYTFAGIYIIVTRNKRIIETCD